MPSKIDFLRAKVIAFKETLERTPPEQKAANASSTITVEFNDILEQLRKESPDAAEHLPRTIVTGKYLAPPGYTNLKLVELEILANQVINILNILKSDI